jgi:hypothetical protein
VAQNEGMRSRAIRSALGATALALALGACAQRRSEPTNQPKSDDETERVNTEFVAEPDDDSIPPAPEEPRDEPETQSDSPPPPVSDTPKDDRRPPPGESPLPAPESPPVPKPSPSPDAPPKAPPDGMPPDGEPQPPSSSKQ